MGNTLGLCRCHYLFRWMNSYLSVRCQCRHSLPLRSTALKGRFGVFPPRAPGIPNSLQLLSACLHLLKTKLCEGGITSHSLFCIGFRYGVVAATQKAFQTLLSKGRFTAHPPQARHAGHIQDNPEMGTNHCYG